MAHNDAKGPIPGHSSNKNETDAPRRVSVDLAKAFDEVQTRLDEWRAEMREARTNRLAMSNQAQRRNNKAKASVVTEAKEAHAGRASGSGAGVSAKPPRAKAAANSQSSIDQYRREIEELVPPPPAGGGASVNLTDYYGEHVDPRDVNFFKARSIVGEYLRRPLQSNSQRSKESSSKGSTTTTRQTSNSNSVSATGRQSAARKEKPSYIDGNRRPLTHSSSSTSTSQTKKSNLQFSNRQQRVPEPSYSYHYATEASQPASTGRNNNNNIFATAAGVDWQAPAITTTTTTTTSRKSFPTTGNESSWLKSETDDWRATARRAEQPTPQDHHYKAHTSSPQVRWRRLSAASSITSARSGKENQADSSSLSNNGRWWSVPTPALHRPDLYQGDLTQHNRYPERSPSPRKVQPHPRPLWYREDVNSSSMSQQQQQLGARSWKDTLKHL